MTNIISIIVSNLTSGPETRRFPDREAPAADFRGSVRMDPEKCMACGICDHVCVSGAIELRAYDDHCEWNYDPGRCTFCARCVDHCPARALAQEGDRPDPYEGSGALVTKLTVAYPACPECGDPALPFDDIVLKRAFSEISDDIRNRVHLCERCRRRLTQSALKRSFGALTDIERNTDEC